MNFKHISNPETHYTAYHILDVVMGNPNGDPMAENQPRVLENGMGMITDVCIKRKQRDYVAQEKSGDDRFNIYIKNDMSLNDKHKQAYKEVGLDSKTEKDDNHKRMALDYMKDHYFDVRMFGAVLNTGNSKEEDNSIGLNHGPIHYNCYRSFDPIHTEFLQITREAITRTDNYVDDGQRNTFGSKWIVPYGLYGGTCIYNPNRGDISKVTSEDLEVFWKSFFCMFDTTMSASRGLMTTQKLFVFEQEPEGSAYIQAGKLTKYIKVNKKEGVDYPICFEDYTIEVDEENIPQGVKLHIFDF